MAVTVPGGSPILGEDVPMSDDGPPTIYDVARVAGVSHQTVSRVLNVPLTVRPETRTRVLAVIAYLGFERNSAAERLARRARNQG